MLFRLITVASWMMDWVVLEDRGVTLFLCFRVTSILVLLQRNHQKSVVYPEVRGPPLESSKIQTHQEKRLEGDSGPEGTAAQAHPTSFLNAPGLSHPLPADPEASCSYTFNIQIQVVKKPFFLFPFRTAETGSNFQKELHLKKHHHRKHKGRMKGKTTKKIQKAVK